MNWCVEHWEALRKQIEELGLSDLSMQSGAQAAAAMADQIERKKVTIANFDAMTFAWANINSNAMAILANAGGDPLYWLAPPETPEDPVVGYKRAKEGLTWPRCPICYMSLAHELTCDGRNCSLPLERGYDYMLKEGAKSAKAKADELRSIEGRQE